MDISIIFQVFALVVLALMPALCGMFNNSDVGSKHEDKEENSHEQEHNRNGRRKGNT